jgi:hypothetical protein
LTGLSWRDVACPRPGCSGQVGQYCTSASGRTALEPHSDRLRAAREAGLPRPLLGYSPQYETPHVVSVADKAKAICGAAIDTIPEIQPPLASADSRCRNLLGKVPYARNPTLTGVCPVCVSEEDLDGDGQVVPHKQMYGGKRSDVDCAGAGELPEVDG